MLLRGVVALDPRTPGAAAELASVLLHRALAGEGELAPSAAWARWALEVDPSDALARRTLVRLDRVMPSA
jgi:hypothetical protein